MTQGTAAINISSNLLENSLGVTRLSLSNFRSYKELHLECDVRPVVLSGENGVGKTNILEAISFLSPGRGLRSIQLAEAAHHSAEKEDFQRSWIVSLSIISRYGLVDLGTGFESKEGESEKRLVRINKRPAKSQASLNEYLSILWITPQMDQTFSSSMTGRRRFLDRLVYSHDATHASRILAYENLMRERLRLLKQGGIHQKSWLTALEAQMAEAGVAITIARLQMIESLKQTKEWSLGFFPWATLSLTGDTEHDLQVYRALEVEERLQKSLEESRRNDADAGRTLKGPHRSDLRVIFETKQQPIEFCSTGEQKALLISLIMGAMRLQTLKGDRVPLLLLDEVVAHLDERRRQALFQEILNLRLQAWMTGTDASVFYPLADRVQHFKIAGGTLERL